MIIYLDKIYSDLECWRAENKITAENERNGYLVNVMEKFGELSQALRGLEFENTREVAEQEIIEALCNIAVLTINAEDDIPARKKETLINTSIESASLHHLIIDCGNYNRYKCNHHFYFNSILKDCAMLCENYGYNFEVAMLEKIRVISSGSGAYSEKANYKKAKIKKMNSTQIMAFNEISKWIKHKDFIKEDLAQILCAVDKECLKALGITISELINKGAENEFSK